MSYTYLQAREGGSWEECSSDTLPSVLSRSNPTVEKCCSSDSVMDCCHGSQSGTMCGPTAVPSGKGRSISSAADFPARTYPLPAKAQESPAPGLDSGPSLPGSFARYDPGTHSLKTHQTSLLEDSMLSCQTLPRWGSMRNGELCQRQTPEHLISGTGSGSSRLDGDQWPTPAAAQFDCQDLDAMLARRERCKEKHGNGNGFGLTLGNAVRMVPTPRSADYKGTVRMWPTPSVGGQGGPTGLAGGAGNRQKLYSMLGEEEGKKMGCSSLNPNWVEWLMGWPIGWTDSAPSATDRFRKLLPWPSGSSGTDCTEINP